MVEPPITPSPGTSYRARRYLRGEGAGRIEHLGSVELGAPPDEAWVRAHWFDGRASTIVVFTAEMPPRKVAAYTFEADPSKARLPPPPLPQPLPTTLPEWRHLPMLPALGIRTEDGPEAVPAGNLARPEDAEDDLDEPLFPFPTGLWALPTAFEDNAVERNYRRRPREP